MARIRTIKPEFWTDEDISSLSEPARLLAIGVLNLSDDEGYFKANPLLLKAAIFPLCDPSVSIQSMITELLSIGYIMVSNGTDGKEYGFVRNFETHQRVNRPTPSKIKHLCNFSESSVSNQGAITTGKERKGKEQGVYVNSPSQAMPDFSPVIQRWNEVANELGLQKILGVTSKRKTEIKNAYANYKKACKDFGKEPKDMIGFLIALIECANVTHTEFHLGGADRDKWKMNFDYLMQKKVIYKVTETGSIA